MITKSAVKAAVSEALERRAKLTSSLKAWKWRVVDATGRDYDTVGRWLAGETTPDSHDLKNLDELFGEEFKNEHEALGSFVAARQQNADHIISANSIKDIRKLAPVLRAAADEIDEHAGKLRPSADKEGSVL